MSKNTAKGLRVVTPIAEYEAQIEGLVKRDADLGAIISSPERAKAALMAARQRRVDLIAEAMAEGRDPDTAGIDAEIAAAVQAEADAIENAKAAKSARERIQANILELQDKISAAERDLRIAGRDGFAGRNMELQQAEADANRRAHEATAEALDARLARRRNAIDYIIGNAECGIRAYEELAPALAERIASLSAAPSQSWGNGFAEVRSITSSGAPHRQDRVPNGDEEIPLVKIHDLRNKATEPGDPKALDDILRRMELALKQSAPFAEIAEEVFDRDETRREMLGILRRIATQVRQACKASNVTAPEWAFAGDNCWRTWIGETEKEPIRQFLRNAGIEC